MRPGQRVSVGQRPNLGAADRAEVNVLQSAAFAAAIVSGVGGGIAPAMEALLVPVGSATEPVSVCRQGGWGSRRGAIGEQIGSLNKVRT